MISAISSFGHYNDPEYLRILSELRKLGIAPSGNKTIDKAKLEQAKAELINKIQGKVDEKLRKDNIEPIAPPETLDDTKRTELETQRLGAMTVAELNRLYFNI